MVYKFSQVSLSQLSLIIIATLLIFNFQTEFTRNLNKHSVRLTFSADTLEHSVLGFKNLAADLLWIRIIQDIDYKEGQVVSKGWVYRYFDAITTLDPRYRMLYKEGVVVLSIIIRDKVGAALLYERGIKNFPKDWEIAYRAGYHYLHEMKDCKRAAELLNSAADNGAPQWIHALASRLYAKSGQYFLARSILEDALKNSKGSSVHQDFENRLRQLDEMYRDPKKTTLIEGLECQGPKM